MLLITPQSHFSSRPWNRTKRGGDISSASSTRTSSTSSSPGENCTRASSIKSRVCCLLTPRSQNNFGSCVSTNWTLRFLQGSVEVVRIERDHSDVISISPATSGRLPFKSGTRESNSEPSAPKADVLPNAPVPDCQYPVRVSLPPILLERESTSLDVLTGHSQWEVPESNGAFDLFRVALSPDQFQRPINKKSPASL